MWGHVREVSAPAWDTRDPGGAAEQWLALWVVRRWAAQRVRSRASATPGVHMHMLAADRLAAVAFDRSIHMQWPAVGLTSRRAEGGQLVAGLWVLQYQARLAFARAGGLAGIKRERAKRRAAVRRQAAACRKKDAAVLARQTRTFLRTGKLATSASGKWRALTSNAHEARVARPLPPLRKGPKRGGVQAIRLRCG